MAKKNRGPAKTAKSSINLPHASIAYVRHKNAQRGPHESEACGLPSYLSKRSSPKEKITGS